MQIPKMLKYGEDESDNKLQADNLFRRVRAAVLLAFGHPLCPKLTLKTPSFQLCYSIHPGYEVVKVDINSLEKRVFTKL